MTELSVKPGQRLNQLRLEWDKLVSFEPTLPAFLAACAAAYRDNTLIVAENQRASFGELEARSMDLARILLAHGVSKGARVGLVMENRVEFAVILFALMLIGAVAVPISTLSSEQELGRIVRHADLAMLITVDRYLSHNYARRLEGALGLAGKSSPLMLEDAPFLREIRIIGGERPGWALPFWDEAAPRAPHAMVRAAERTITPADPAIIIYTSGSTAAPKGVLHSHGGLVRQARRLAATMPYQKGDIVATSSPMFWVGGLMMGLMLAMPIGITVVFAPPGAGAALEVFERERVTWIHTWPHQARQLANHPSFTSRDLSSVIGGTVPEAIAPELRGKNQITNALGMSETMGPHTGFTHGFSEDMAASFGPPAPGMEHRIVDVETRAPVADGAEGELEVRGDTLMLGYVGKERSETFTPDGWFRTGDRCRLHNGHIFFNGRIDDMIKCAGANVSPREVEAALCALPGVSAAHAIGLADAARATSVAAAVVLEAGAAVSVAEIRAHAKQTLSSYKVPRVIRICAAEELPLTASAKIDRRRLVSLLERRDPVAADSAA
jgi:acyl-CoA synthetase (AMP-forming)/AMP-acid ligase II